MSPTVLITGCTDHGLGASLAKTFAERGCKVIATLRLPVDRCTLKHPNVTILPLDVTSQESVNSIAGYNVDILINNAGRTVPGPVLDVDVDKAAALMDANVYGMIRVIKAVAPGMIKRRRGLVVNIGSCVAIIPTPLSGAYAASKAAVHAYTEVLSEELRPFNVHTLLVAPGAITSNIASTGLKDYHAPANSLYQDYTKAVLDRISLSQTEPARLSSEQAAKIIVDRVLGPDESHLPLFGFLGMLAIRRWWLGPIEARWMKTEGVLRLGKMAHVLYWLNLLLPRAIALRIVGKQVMKRT